MYMSIRWKGIRGWFYPLAIGFAIAFFIRHWVVAQAYVPTESMRPTIPNPCYILVNKLSVELTGLHRGEVVTFHFPDNPQQIFVKRIVGMPGDTVVVKSDEVLVNGKPFIQPNIVHPNGDALGTYHVPAGHYFMLGDNRPISDDSRLWVHKYVARSAIIGQAEFVLFP